MTKDEMRNLMKAIREKRLKMGVSQETVARKAGITVGAYNSLEGGKTTPRQKTLSSIINAINEIDVENAQAFQKMKSSLTKKTA
jgi:predicted transcriptional regulator